MNIRPRAIHAHRTPRGSGSSEFTIVRVRALMGNDRSQSSAPRPSAVKIAVRTSGEANASALHVRDMPRFGWRASGSEPVDAHAFEARMQNARVKAGQTGQV